MMKKALLAGIVVAVCSATACTNSFRICKDGKGYFLGTSTGDLEKWLCDTGDLRKILAHADLSPERKEDLYAYNCGPARSAPKVREIYVSMNPVERKSLRTAFKKNGYEINAMTC